MGELVLITGTSSGIGLSAAVECAAAGHRVVATMRNPEGRKALLGAAEARGVTVDVEQLDVTADGAGAKIRELTLKYGPVFALVNNAGVLVSGPFEEQSEDDVHEQFETNVFGMMAVTRAMLPSMRAAQRGRIINVSSVVGRVAFPLWSVYAATKHAVEGFSESLRWEVEPFGVEVCLVEPGTFRTAMMTGIPRRGSAPLRETRDSRESSADGHEAGGGGSPKRPSWMPPASEPPNGPPRSQAPAGPYAALSETVEKMLLDEIEKAPPPDAVGKAIAGLVTDPSPRFRTLVGIDARTLVTLRRMVPDRLFASGIRRLLQLPRSR